VAAASSFAWSASLMTVSADRHRDFGLATFAAGFDGIRSDFAAQPRQADTLRRVMALYVLPPAMP
jgi:hypothetical protein